MPNAEIKALRDEMGTTFEAFKVANDEKLAASEKRHGVVLAEHVEKVETLNSEITELRTALRDAEVRSKRPGNQTTGVVGDEVKTPEMELRSAAYEKYIRYGMGESAAVSMSPEERRALAGTSDTDGQFLAPAEFESNLIVKAFNRAEIRPLAQVGTTGRDTVKMGALSKPIVGWGSRGLEVPKQTLTAGGATIKICNLRALALISNDTLDDAEANIMAELETQFEQAVAEAEDDAFATGVDPNSPSGIVANVAVQANFTKSGIAALLTDDTHNGFDAMKTMFYGLKKSYRRNSTWGMNSTVESILRLVKDADGRYIWDPNLDTDGVVKLYGRPVVNPEGMPDIAAGAIPIFLGDVGAGLKIRDRSGITIIRLTELYSGSDQTAFQLKKRVGSAVTLPEAFRVLKIAA